MDTKNTADCTGYVNIRVQISNTITADVFRDSELFKEWIIEQIANYDYKDVELLKDDTRLCDFRYVEYE